MRHRQIAAAITGIRRNDGFGVTDQIEAHGREGYATSSSLASRSRVVGWGDFLQYTACQARYKFSLQDFSNQPT